MNNFVTAQGWYEPDSPKPQTLRNLAVSLSLETAEVLEHFQWNEDEIDEDELGQELADVALYLLQIASATNHLLQIHLHQYLTQIVKEKVYI